MHALVAESNVVTRVALRRILERAGYRVDELRDELAAACLLHQPSAPALAFLSLETLLVDFREVCIAMRGADPDVYIVAIVPESRRIDVRQVLDDGADDFIITPASFQETEARVEVIHRTLNGGPAIVADDDPRAAARKDRGPTIDGLLQEIAAPEVLSNAFVQMGLEPAATCDPVETPPAFSSWVPMLVLQAGAGKWMNVRIDLDQENAPKFLAAVQKRGRFSEARVLQVLGEVMGLTQDVIRGTCEQVGSAGISFPVESMALPADQIPSPRRLAGTHADLSRVGLRLGEDVHLTITLSIEPIRLESLSVNNVEPFDILGIDIQSAEQRLMLLRSGTMLGDDHIRRIQAFIHSQDASQVVKVYRPPARTVQFLQQLAAS